MCSVTEELETGTPTPDFCHNTDDVQGGTTHEGMSE